MLETSWSFFSFLSIGVTHVFEKTAGVHAQDLSEQGRREQANILKSLKSLFLQKIDKK